MQISPEFGFVAEAAQASKPRRFLLLQGVCSPFFSTLAAELRAAGHYVHKVNFNGGDVAYWRGAPATSFRQHLEMLPSFIADLYERLEITDQVLFGDCRPVHRVAVQKARLCEVRTHVFEEGYFRPHWITLERDGVNAYSHIPRSAQWFREAAERLPEVRIQTPFSTQFGFRAVHDVAYHLASLVNPLLYYGYRSHAPNAAVQYLGYIGRLPKLKYREIQDSALIEALKEKNGALYLLPLQLDNDSQIRHHSRFANMAAVMRKVIRSFSLHAPSDARLLIKNHPLDLGLAGHEGTARNLARQFGVEDRVYFIETGNLDRILDGASGTVTVNSTVGSVSLSHGCPTHCMADPIYNIPGLTFQGDLDDFWKADTRPDATLFNCFRKTVIHAAQINGGFYSDEGIRLAARNAVPRLVAVRSPLEVLS